jgi:hypothetical protein
MKKTISTGMFLVGLVIWAGIISFLIELPFSSILNTEDYLPASLTAWIKILIWMIALFVSVYIGCKRYIVPTPISRLTLWIVIIYLIFGLTNLLFLPILLGSSNVLALASVQAIISQVVGSMLAGGATYVALRLFSQGNSPSATQ